MWIIIIIGVIIVGFAVWFVYHQRMLRLRAHLMQEAIRNKDFTFRMPTHGLLPGERAMQETLNQLGETIRQQVNQNEVESWERLTRVLTHEMMNATAPITSISQSMLNRSDVKDTPLENGIRAIYETSRHLSDFVVNYRKMSELEKPVLTDVRLHAVIDEISKAYPQLTWEVSVPADLVVRADIGMLRQVLMNLVKNAIEANATKMIVEETDSTAEANSSLFTHHFSLYIGNDGLPIPAENRQSLFVPFFTTKRSGSGIGLSLSRRMMIQQGGMLDLAETPLQGCHAAFILSLQV
ncbi:MAG: HAMP domain-containing histidine kinase [Prevotella sp.]|nr:HAMP domain-containing histidine kinase [Prevotella sp.]